MLIEAPLKKKPYLPPTVTSEAEEEGPPPAASKAPKITPVNASTKPPVATKPPVVTKSKSNVYTKPDTRIPKRLPSKRTGTNVKPQPHSKYSSSILGGKTCAVASKFTDSPSQQLAQELSAQQKSNQTGSSAVSNKSPEIPFGPWGTYPARDGDNTPSTLLNPATYGYNPTTLTPNPLLRASTANTAAPENAGIIGQSTSAVNPTVTSHETVSCQNQGTTVVNTAPAPTDASIIDLENSKDAVIAIPDAIRTTIRNVLRRLPTPEHEVRPEVTLRSCIVAQLEEFIKTADRVEASIKRVYDDVERT